MAEHHVGWWDRICAMLGVGTSRTSKRLRRVREPRLFPVPRHSRPYQESASFPESAGHRAECKTWACQLQGTNGGDIEVEQIAASDVDVVIIDYSRDGSRTRAFNKEDVAHMRAGRAEKKIVAYLSIGEAEEARYYWQKSWIKNGKPSKSAPAWLYRTNEGGWTDNFRVKFWDSAWQALIVNGPGSYLDQIIDAGFDGVFLDIIEAGEFWEDEARGTQRRPTASDDMIKLVELIARHARDTRGKGAFLVIPNGDFLLENAHYRSLISAIMREEVLYKQRGRANEPAAIVARPEAGFDGVKLIAERLQYAAADGIPVLAIEYLLDHDPPQADPAEAAHRLMALAPTVIPYFSVRYLDRLCPPYTAIAGV